jgi:hypothetical protein
MMKKKLLLGLILLLNFGLYSQNQWGNGIKWIYTSYNPSNNPFYGIDEYEFLKDTSIHGDVVKIILQKKTLDKHILSYTQEGIHYWFKNSWLKIASYTQKIGDTTQLKAIAINPKTLKKDTIVSLSCKLITVDTLYTENSLKLRQFNFEILNSDQFDTEWRSVTNYSFIENIGFEEQFIPTIELNSIDIVTPLRCVYSGDDHFISSYWKLQNQACEYITSIEKNDITEMDYILYDNKVSVLSDAMIEFFSVTGKLEKKKFCTKGNSVDFDELQNGIYIVKITLENNRVEKLKIFIR